MYDLMIKVHTKFCGGKMKVKLCIKEVRERFGYTLKEMSKITGISSSHLNYLEKGERRATIDVLCQIAEKLHIDEKELYTKERE